MKTYADLLALAESSPIIAPPAAADLTPSYASASINGSVELNGSSSDTNGKTTRIPLREADDDPHRLAKSNLDRYRAATKGGTIRYWRENWYTWKPDRGFYQLISDNDFRTKLTASIKSEFNQICEAKIEDGVTDEYGYDPMPQKVTRALVANVLDAMKSMVLIPESTELNSWIDDKTGERMRRRYIAMKNGILDFDRLLENRDEDTLEDLLLPPSPQWFSTNRLPYDFKPGADCPIFDAFLEQAMEGDQERLDQLQEWAGYIVSQETTFQTFLAMEGEGGNGKSVYIAAIEALIGPKNCSSVSLEDLGDKFVRSQTLGKLVNCCPDANDKSEKVSEGDLKSFVSGDVMFFDRKYKDGLNCVPTARLMVSWNNCPKWADKSDGIWRRILLVAFNFKIADKRKIRGMDTASWWEASGDLPGMFNWAVGGLVRLKQQGRFTKSQLGEREIEERRMEANPTRRFLREFMQEANEYDYVSSKFTYRTYEKWCQENGYRNVNHSNFGKELKRIFKNSGNEKKGPKGEQFRAYTGVKFQEEEISDIDTSEITLF